MHGRACRNQHTTSFFYLFCSGLSSISSSLSHEVKVYVCDLLAFRTVSFLFFNTHTLSLSLLLVIYEWKITTLPLAGGNYISKFPN